MSCLDNTDKVIIPSNMLLDMMNLYRFSGKDSYYNSIFKKDLTAYRNVNVINETFYFAKLMELNIKDERIMLLAKKEVQPKNNSEKIVLNLKKVFNLILFNIEHFELLPNEIQDLVNLMFQDIAKFKYRVEKTKGKSSLTNKKEVLETIKYDLVLEEMIKKFNSLYKTKEYEVTLLITNFFIDFYNTKVFEDLTDFKANEFCSYLILYILLFKYEFDAFNYRPFFKQVYENMKTFHFCISESSFNWSSGYANVTNTHKFIIERLLECYNGVEDEKQKQTHVADNKISKTNDVEVSIANYPDATFTKADIQALHPNVSPKTIERTLERLQQEGKVESLGTGRSARWMKKFKLQSGFEYDAISFNLDDALEEKK